MITSILLYRFVTLMRYTSLIFSVEKTFIVIVTTAICEMLCDESDDPLIAVIASPLSVLTTRIARLLLLPLGRPSSAIFYLGVGEVAFAIRKLVEAACLLNLEPWARSV